MNSAVIAPASCDRRPTVAVLGAGIAGLTAAHELAERGFDVTVYEARADERTVLDSGTRPGRYPPLKLGGLAASQYSKVGCGGPAELRPFPGRPGSPPVPGRTVAGEHGFRFFPAYYLHIWDLFQRIPVYEYSEQAAGEFRWQPTPRTVMDNVRRVVTQGTTVAGKPSLVFPREAPRTLAEFLSAASQLTELGFTTTDVQTFVSRLVRYLTTSPRRRASELQNLSAYDFFIGRDATAARRFFYTPGFDALLMEMPRVLAAFDSHWGDARTNLTTYLQLQLQMDRHDNKADGVLNGPTTEAWFDHWYRYLVELGVRFVHAAVDRVEPPVVDRRQPPHLRARAQVRLTDGTRLAPDYTVVAVDAPAAELVTTALRAVGTGGTVAGLDGFTTSAPPPDGPLQPGPTRPPERRDPRALNQMGRLPWDRFQTLAGIQFFFDTEFQLLRGHMYYSGTEWALSSINQHGLWERRPTLARDGHVSVLSVDIGDFNTPSRHLVDESGRGKAARDCTPDELATEVWRQLSQAITSNVNNVPEALLPWPAWYALDRNLVMAAGSNAGPAIRNEAPYLVPIVGDWPNRPGADPWNPHGSSLTIRPFENQWLANLDQRDVWQARHGGYEVHNNSVVFAGTWTKTFTRMTSMEAACESARHAVNAILDHYVWVRSGGVDRREDTILHWLFPYGFLDQGFSSPIRMPTPAGDYCYIFDIENREPLETRGLRKLDSECFRASLPHPFEFGAPASPIPTLLGGQLMTTPPTDSAQQLLAYLQAWRHYLEQVTGVTAPTPPFPPAPWTMTATAPAAPFAPPPMPAAPFPPPPMPIAPAGPVMITPQIDYTQQLLTYLQAWRQYLEQAMPAAAPGQPTAPSAPAVTTVAATPERPRPSASPPASSALETLPPWNPDASQLTGPMTWPQADVEPHPSEASLFDKRRSGRRGSVPEERLGSAYPSAAHPATSGPLPQDTPIPLYSNLGRSAPTRWDSGERLERPPVPPDRPEPLEVVEPFNDSSR